MGSRSKGDRSGSDRPRRGNAVRRWPVLAAVLALAAIGVRALAPPATEAHALYDHSDPPANAIVPNSPAQVSIWFTERLEPASSTARLDDQTGKVVAGTTVRPGAEPKAMVVSLPAGLANGTYSVVWQTMSADDGHSAEGYFAFTVGTAADVQAIVPPAPSAGGPSLWLQTVARWAALAGLAAALAVWPLWLFVLRPAISPAWQAGPGLVRRARRHAFGTVLFALLASAFALAVQAENVHDVGWSERLRTTLLDTRYGRLWLARESLFLVYAIALAGAAWWWPRRRPVRTLSALSIALALPVPFSLIAHASAQSAGRATAVAGDVLHLTAASLWIGGLVLLLGVLVPTLRDLTPAGRRVVLSRAIPRFSMVALTAWGVLGLTGLYSAWVQVGNLNGLRTTAYGHSLTAKLILLVPLLGLGAYNLLVVAPELRRARGNPAASLAWSRHLAVAVAAEVVLALAVLLVVGRLTDQAPAREAITQQAGHAVLGLDGNGRSATLSITPAATGPNHYRLEVAGATLPAGTEALLRLTPPGNGIGEKEITLIRAVGNAFEGHGSELSIAGDWQIEVIVRKIGSFQWQATKGLSVGVQPPTVRLPRPAWHFERGGLAALALLVLGIAAVVVAWAAGRTRLRARSAILGAAATAVAIGLLLGVRTNAPAATGAAIPGTQSAAAQLDASAVARGRTTFLANCAACHGTTGKGDGPAAASLNPPPVDFTSPLHRQHKAEDLILWVTQGIPGSAMPAFGGKLSDAQIRDVVTYVQSLSLASAAGSANTTTVSPTPDVPAPNDCQVEPRSLAAILSAAATPVASANGAATSGTPSPFVWPRGVPAADADVGRITRTFRAFVACGNAGDFARRLAFYSERYLREFYGGLSAADHQRALDAAATPAAALPADQRAWIDTIETVRVLPDGRIGAHIVVQDPSKHPHLQSFVVIFVQENGRWLIDELHPETAGSTPPATPESVPPVGPGTPVTSGGLVAALQQEKFATGLNVLTFRFVDPRGQPVTGLSVSVAAAPGQGGAGTVSARALETNSGRYVADLPFGATGSWTVVVVVTQNGKQSTFTFDIAVT